MNLEETIALVECLKSSGATYYKSRDFEVSFVRSKRPDVKRPLPRVAPPKRQAEEAEAQAPLFENTENTQKAKDLIGTLRDPEKLLDAVFPDGAGG